MPIKYNIGGTIGLYSSSEFTDNSRERSDKVGDFFNDIYLWSGVDEDHPLFEIINLLVKTDEDVDLFDELYDGDFECLDRTINKMIRLLDKSI